jgi:GH15 family glucan-1,4-alpha-glucosidase
VRAGDRICCSLAYTKADIGVIAPLGAAAEQRLEDTVKWWQSWSRQARYAGPYRDAVVRSALALKLLTYALSGAVVAAPSTSLPESLGADRNWDYRYCWLRDAALTMRAFIGLGYLDEARAFFDWMLHATRLTWPELRVLYDVYGRTELTEKELGHWRGFCDSRPVRIGNGAHSQLQLDVYGAVCLAAHEFARATGTLAADEARLLRGFGQSVCREWQQPDHGIWEIRGEPRQYTFSKVMCWTALDALIQLSERGLMSVPPGAREARTALRELIETRGYNPGLRTYTAALDGEDVDASLLLLGCLGYADPASEHMRGTYSRVHERLARNGLLLRYERGFDGFAAPEGAFGICSFWAIDNLARRGDREEAHRAFRHVTGLANDVGLLAEQIDPDSGVLLGNFPQAYTHVGLINAALAMEQH